MNQADDHETRSFAPASASRYDRLEPLRAGGMGEVYRALQTELQRVVALKLIRPERMADPQFVARFRREARAMARLNHPNIVTVYDFGEWEGRPYLAMEFVEGTTLQARLSEGSPPPSQALELAIQLCDAIAYAHEQGIIHRDLKPANVLVTREGRVKVADFGLAKLIHPQDQLPLTNEGGVLGTFRYMAPEQLAGSAEVDARADVYSLGVVLYELFTGQPPLGRFAPPSHVAAIDPRLDDPILRALESDPGRRFANAGELGTALARLRREAPTTGIDATLAWSTQVTIGNLPSAVTSFVGRDEERQLLRASLARHRLITLTGPGGTGKSRLALQLGSDVASEFPQGAWFVPLAEISDSRHVASAIAHALGLREDGRELHESLQEFLASRSILLVLDNFEQVVDAAPLVARLLAAAPRLKAIITSRIALRVAGEHDFHVNPLPLPSLPKDKTSLDLVRSSPAAALFVERARRFRPELEVTERNVAAIVEICQRVEGLPLAIELAAARVKLLSLESIAERLSSRLRLLTGGTRDLPARQQTMRAAIAWSYDLLTPPQKTCLAWLSAFRGSFTVASAEALVRHRTSMGTASLPQGGGPLDDFDVLDSLTCLVEHNLARQVASEPEPRFAFLEIIREFAEEHLGGLDEQAALRHAHADWCLETTRRGEPELIGPDPRRVLAQWDCELPDFRAALAWWRGAGNRPDDALKLLGELWFYWVLRSRPQEGIQEALATTELAHASPDTPELSRALHALGTLYFLRDRPQDGRSALERALDIRRRRESAQQVYATLGNLASIKRAMGDLEGARRDLEEVLEYRRREGNPKSIAIALSNLSLVLQFLGHLDESRALIDEAIATYGEMHDQRGVMRQYLNRGRVEHSRSRYIEALEDFESALRISREIDDQSGMLNATLAVINSLVSLERFDKAESLLMEHELELLNDESDSRRASSFIVRGYLFWKKGKLDEALSDYRACLRLRANHEDWCGVGELLVEFANIFVAKGRFTEAAQLIGAEQVLRNSLRYAVNASTWSELMAARRTIVDQMGESECQAAEREGSSWSRVSLVERLLGDMRPR